MDPTQNYNVGRPKRTNVPPQHYQEVDGGRRNNRDFAGTHRGKSYFKHNNFRGRNDQTDEISALTANLQDSQFQQHLYYCKWMALDRKCWTLKTQLDEVSNKYRYSTADAERTIQELKDQLERARSDETKSYLEEIHTLKFELKEAAVVRINAANRLILADKIIASQNFKQDESNKSNTAAKASQTDLDFFQRLLNAQTDLMDLREEVEKTRASNLAQLEQQQEENSNMAAALKRAEEQRAALQETLQRREEEVALKESIIETKLDELMSMTEKESDKKTPTNMGKSQLARLFKVKK